MSGVEGKSPSPAQLAEVRSRALARLEELSSGAVLEEDITRLRNSDEYVSRSEVREQERTFCSIFINVQVLETRV